MGVPVNVPNGCNQWMFPWMFPMDVLNGCSCGCSQWMYWMGVPADVPNGCTEWVFLRMFPMDVLNGCSQCDVPNGCTEWVFPMWCSQWMYWMGVHVDIPMGVLNGCSRWCSQCDVPMARFPEPRGMGSPKSACVAGYPFAIEDFWFCTRSMWGPNWPKTASLLSLCFSFSLARAQRVCSTL